MNLQRARGNPIWDAWSNMRRRCYDTKNKMFSDYGGRGIEVCDEWRESSATFVAWSVANGWRPGLTLDRRDNSAGYSPGNCRWVSRLVQSNNRRRRRRGSGVPTGVFKEHSKYRVSKTYMGQRFNLGRFDNIEAAKAVYDSACRCLHG